jgi:lipopolysaccharide cholinephosphotransferase
MINTESVIYMRQELTQKEIQDVALDILKKVAAICEENDFRYLLMYGTLIGAIRHKGFIPWDDDLDIMMPRPDYDRFLEYMKTHEIPNLKILNPDTSDKYPYMITRVSDDRYEMIADNEIDYGAGVFIDIYPFDGLGTDKKKSIKFGLKGDRISSFCYQASRKSFQKETTTSKIKYMMKLPVYHVSKAFGYKFFQKKLEKLVGKHPYDKSEYVGCVVWLSGGIKDIFKRSWFDDYIMAPYEDSEFRIPKKYDRILRHIYGDYMQLPPESDRVGHHCYKIYRKND